MKVDENGTVFKLDQTVKEEEKTQPTKKPSRRKNKFRLATAEPTISTTVERVKTMVTFAEEATCRAISSGEPTSQVVEEKQLKSPSEKETSVSGDGKLQVELSYQDQSAPIKETSNMDIQHIEDISVVAVQTRAQKKKAEEQQRRDEEATAQSGAVLTPLSLEIEREQDNESDGDNAEDAGPGSEEPVFQPNDCNEAEESGEESEVTVTKSQLIISQQQDVTKSQLIISQQQDESVKKMYEEAEQEGSAFVVRGGVLYRRPFTWSSPTEREDIDNPEEEPREEEPLLVVIPKDLRRKVLERGHDLAGHMGIKKTKKMVQAHFYWPQMGQDIVQHCKTCKECLKFNHKKTKKEPLHPLPVISTPWERIAIDIVGKLPRTARGHSYILTLMDFGTRYMEAIPLKRVDAHTTCEALLEVFARFGVPKEVLSDNGSNFIATVTETLMKKLKCYHIKASPFHPQTNGMLERSHQVLKKTLDKLGCTKKNWDDYLAPTLMALRTAPHAALGVTPFELMFGREARTPIDALREEMEGEQKTPRSVVKYMQDLYQRMEESQELVEREDSKAKDKSKTYYDKRKKSDPLKEGEFVLMMTPKGEESLTCQWQGPYKILRRLGDTTYLVDAPYKNGKRGRKCHRNLLKRYFLQVMSTAVMLALEGDNIAEFPHFKPEETDKERKWKEANLDGDLTDALSRELPGEHLTDHTQPPEEGGGVGPAQPETQD